MELKHFPKHHSVMNMDCHNAYGSVIWIEVSQARSETKSQRGSRNRQANSKFA